MKKFMSLFLAGVLTVSLVGCGTPKKTEDSKTNDEGNAKKQEEKDYSGTITVGFEKASGTFNPLYASSAYDQHIVDLMFEGLLTMDKKGDPAPLACEKYEISEDGKTVTFNMKKGMKFSDGEEVTADDVVFTYKVLSDPSYSGKAGEYSQDLVGFEEYNGKKSEEFKGVEKIDDYTVKFNYKEKLRENLTHSGCGIIPEHYYGKDFKYGDTSSIEALADKPMGSGPYTLKTYKPGELAALTRNPIYYGEGYKIENVICKFVESTTDIEELTSGNIDVLPEVIEVDKISKAKADDKLTFNAYPRAGYGYIKFNCENGVTKEKEVRQALYYAFDVKSFVNNFFKEKDTGEVLATTQYHPYTQCTWGVDEDFVNNITSYDYDIEKSKKILDDAGWKVGDSGYREKNGQILELKLTAIKDHNILATLIPMWQAAWGDELKCKIDVAILEFNTLMEYVETSSDDHVNDWNTYFMANTFTSADPGSIYTDYHSQYIGSGKSNTGRYNNPKVDELLDKGKEMMTKEEATPVYKEIAQILNDDAVVVPVYASTYHDLYNNKLKNFKTDSFYNWIHALQDATVEE